MYRTKFLDDTFYSSASNSFLQKAILVSGFGRSVFKSFDNMGGGKLKLPQVVCTQQYNLNE